MRSILFSLLLVGCAATPPSDGRDDSFLAGGKTDSGISEGSPEAAGVLAVVNALSEDQLRDDVDLSDTAASNIASHGTFETLAELDAVPYVGPTAFRKLLAYAKANGYVHGSSTTVGHGTLLDCNTPVGPDQQVTVIGDGTSLTLRELTTSGSQVSRALSVTEWSSGKLHLRDDFGSTTTMTKDSNGWVVHESGGGVSEIGDADCWVDKSP